MRWINSKIKSPYKYENLIYDCLYENEIYTFEIIDDRTVDELEKTKPYWVEIDHDLRIGEEFLYIKFNIEDTEENFSKISNISDFLINLSTDIHFEFERNCESYDWSKEWKKFFKPLEVAKSFVIVPTWENYNNVDNKIILHIDPGMAFGTGSHETTTICLSLLEEMDIQDKIVCDVGTGSGILSIACAKLGSSKVTAIDIDPQSIITARENVKINDCEKNIIVKEGDLLTTSNDRFDIVIANILPDVIVNLIPQAYERMNNEGLLLVSGIILDKKDFILDKLIKHNFSIVKSLDIGEWTGIIGRKNV